MSVRNQKLVLLGLAFAVLSGCQAQGGNGDDPGGGYDPKPPAELTTEILQENLQANGRRVMVVFGDFRTTKGLATCPIKVRTVDDVCTTNNFQSRDPSVVCRLARGASKNSSLTEINWRADVDGTPDADVSFRIEFDDGYMPCDDSWTGDKPQPSQTCQLRDRIGLQIGGARRNYVKYTVVGTDAACPPLDPYFIVGY